MFGKDLLKKIKNAELTGEYAHGIYSPPYRPQFSSAEILNKNPKLASVNILLYLKNNEWYFPLMVRSENIHDRHSGQISLPGGKREPEDSSNFYIHAFVSYTKKNPVFDFQIAEVAELIEFPVSSLLSLTDEPEMMALPSTRGIKVPVISFNGYIVWGATSMILNEFSHLLKNL